MQTLAQSNLVPSIDHIRVDILVILFVIQRELRNPKSKCFAKLIKL